MGFLTRSFASTNPFANAKTHWVVSGLIASLILCIGVLNSQPTTAMNTQACIDLNSGRFELDTKSGEVEFVIDGCNGKLHRWSAQQKQTDTRL